MPYKDKEKQRRAEIEWRDDNPDYMTQYWRKRNEEKASSEAERKREWYLKNKERKAQAQRAYRAKKKKEAIKNLLNER